MPAEDNAASRFGASPWGQVVISVAIVVTLFCVLVTNLPPSRVREDLSKLSDPFLNATGLDQYWGVFAPDPRRQALMFEARITYAEGGSEMWRPPKGPALIGTFWDYRWEKVTEALPYAAGPSTSLKQLQRDVKDIHRATAAWVARTQADPKRKVSGVTLIRGSYPLPPPRKGAAKKRPFRKVPFYRYSAYQAASGG